VVFALMRRHAAPGADVGRRVVDHLPGFLLGYVALAIARFAIDRTAGPSPVVAGVLAADRLAVDVLMATVTAAIGLHLEALRLLASGWKALAVGGCASFAMAALTLAMLTLAARGASGLAAAVGAGGLTIGAVAYRTKAGPRAEDRLLAARFARDEPMTVAETTRMLDRLDHEGRLDDAALRRAIRLLSPSIGELIPIRASPLPHGIGCRWATFWEGASGWALVAVCRDPRSETPIHAHPHRLLGKSIEGATEELRFEDAGGGRLRLVERRELAHGDVVETDGLATPHLVRAVGGHHTIDLQLRGPESGAPGRRYRATGPLDLDTLAIGALIPTCTEIDDRPGHAGDGARTGRLPSAHAT